MAFSPEMMAAYRHLWSLVQQGAAMRDEQGRYALRSSDIVSAAAQLARDAGQALSFAEASAIPSLFALARGNDRAGAALVAGDLAAGIDASMVGQWPTAPSLATQAAQPKYLAKAQFTYTNALGEQTTGWVTLTNITQLPASKQTLLARLQGAAMSAYTATPQEGGSPKTDAEVMASFDGFTSYQLYSV